MESRAASNRFELNQSVNRAVKDELLDMVGGGRDSEVVVDDADARMVPDCCAMDTACIMASVPMFSRTTARAPPLPVTRLCSSSAMNKYRCQAGNTIVPAMNDFHSFDVIKRGKQSRSMRWNTSFCASSNKVQGKSDWSALAA